MTDYRINMKYRKKPVVIEAFQMTCQRRWDNFDWPQWLHLAWQKEGIGALFCKAAGTELFINTLEGEVRVTFSDYIIQGIEGELYPCKESIFKATYEEVNG